MTVVTFLLSLAGATGALAWAYARSGRDATAPWLAAIAAAWLLTEWRRWRWFPPLGLFLLIGFAAYGLWIGLPAPWMVCGALGALFAWDLGDFRNRLRHSPSPHEARAMEARHLARLLIVGVLGAGLAGLTAVLRVRMSLELLIGLVLLTALGLAQLFRWLGSGRG
jgi:hypothetical protein